MDPKTWQQAIDVYDTYGDLSPEEFKSEIEKLSLTRELKNLLIDLKSKENDASNYFDDLSGNVTGLIEPPMPETIGRWTVKSLIDRGGMSSVYLAERNDEQFSMKAAAKFIHYAGYNPLVVKRFKREMQFLALLNHPNITRIIDSGVSEHGVPWYVMEYVEGVPITQYCNENSLSLEERLRLFLQVSNAVQHAHKNLVIHRDLKPSNIFVDTNGQVKLLDFGIAKALSPESAENPGQMLTRENQALMTPEYASPEQLEGSQVSTASDVYSLGVILYELITGQRPYQFEEFNPVQMVNRIKERPANRPSAIIKKSDSKPAGIQPKQIGSELDDILLTALRPEPEHRYESAEQLGRDIKNYLNNEPVMARDDSRRYRFQKFIQRNKAAAIATLFSALILFSAAIAVVWQADQTRKEAERAVAMKDFLVTMITASNPFVSPGETPTVRDLLDYGSRNIEEELRDQPVLAAELLGVIGASYRGLGEMPTARRYLEQSLVLAEENPGLDPVSEAEIKATYAHTLIGTGELEKAREMAGDVLASLEGIRDAERVRGTLLNIKATTYFITANYERALELALQAADTTCGTFGEAHRSCIASLLELKYFYERVGEYDAALETSERAYNLALEMHTGDPHPQLIMAAGAYGDALALFARTDESIPLLEQNVEHSLEVYGEENFRYARAKDWLSLSYQAAGRTHDVLPLVQRLFIIGENALPKNPLTPIWLHREVQSAIHLRKPGIARQTLDTRNERLPERYPEHISHAYAIQDLLIRLQTDGASPQLQQEMMDLLEELTESGSSQLPEARLAALAISLENRDPETALEILDRSEAMRDMSYDSDITPARLYIFEARYYLLMNEPDNALQSIHTANDFLSNAGHTRSPFIAELNATMAEILCRTVDIERGLEYLDQSIYYWEHVASNPSAIESMNRIAPACS